MNNSFYLARNYKGEYATAGSIFMDYRNASDFSDAFSIIYGHRMGGGRMFADVTRFAEEDYFNEHSSGALMTTRGNFGLRIAAFAKIRADDVTVYDVDLSKTGLAIDYLWDIATYKREKWAGNYILLSTCDALDKSLRDVLLVNVYGDGMLQ